MTPSERLLVRIALETTVTVPAGTVIRRTHAGRLQRQADAWSWFALSPNGQEVCGSYYPVKRLLRAAHIVASDDFLSTARSIYPLD